VKSKGITPILTLIMVAGAAVPTIAQTADDAFYKAYYLDRETGQHDEAINLYNVAVKSPQTSPEIRTVARVRAAALQEEMVAADFASLMPPHTFAYIELNRPGDQIQKLLQQLGLLGDENGITTETGNRVAVSPALVRELLGIRGAALAVTGFDPAKEMPSGVAVFHPGNVDMIRGVIETGLPVGGAPTSDIGGFPTYRIEGKVYVTLTNRLVIVSTDRSEINGVIDRLAGREKSSLANASVVAAELKNRDDSMIFFCLNPKPIMPTLQLLMAAAGNKDQEVALIRTLLDPDSLHSVIGRIGIADDQLFANVSLNLDEQHKNIIFNLFQTPGVRKETLEHVPGDAAVVLTAALNPPAPRSKTGVSGTPSTAVSLLDIGREIFSNINSFACFVLPPGPESYQMLNDREPMPDCGIVFTVNDPAKSKSLWTTAMGIASLASGAAGTSAEATMIEGVEVYTYAFDDGPAAHFATLDQHALITLTRSAMTRAIQAERSGQSILQDKMFAAAAEQMEREGAKGIFAHGGRCVKMSKAFMHPSDIKEAGPFLDRMGDTTVTLLVGQTQNRMSISAEVHHLPEIGDVISNMIKAEQQHEEARRMLASARRGRHWDRAQMIIDALIKKNPDSISLWTEKLDLYVSADDQSQARNCLEKIRELAGDDANSLNNVAWRLLTQEKYDGAFHEFALSFSERSNELTGHKNWAYVDTLARAKFESGDVHAAIELQKQAVELAGSRGGKSLREALARYEAAVKVGEKQMSKAES
jgi:tetratricopeptide (TPR) repeat protein